MFVGVMHKTNPEQIIHTIYSDAARAFSICVVASKEQRSQRSLFTDVTHILTFNSFNLTSENGFKKIVENIAILRGFKTLLADIAELKLRDQMLS